MAAKLDAADLRQSKFQHKYDGAALQMLAYVDCLKKNGFVR